VHRSSRCVQIASRMAAMRGAIFADESKIITWYRRFEFQQLTLKLITQRMLHATPLYDVPRPPKKDFRGDVKMKSLALEVRVFPCTPAASTLELLTWPLSWSRASRVHA
jgi:hypothetical protein